MKRTVGMIVIGVDTHKSTRTLAAVGAASGRLLGTRTIEADRRGMLAGLRFARALAGERVWAIEDCRHVSGRLERALIGHGERLVRVAPGLMGEARRGERSRGKSDARAHRPTRSAFDLNAPIPTPCLT
jgi:transposase